MGAKEILLKQHFIKSVMEKARNADLAIVGLGSSPQYFEPADIGQCKNISECGSEHAGYQS